MFLSDRDMEGHWGVSLSLLCKCMRVLECVNMLCPSLSANIILVSSFLREGDFICTACLLPISFTPLLLLHLCPATQGVLHLPGCKRRHSPFRLLAQSFYQNSYMIVCSWTVKPSSLLTLHYSSCQTITCGKLRAIINHSLISQAYTLQQNPPA